MDNNTPIVSGWHKYFLPSENKSIIPTLLFGFLVFLFYSIYESVHFNPFSPSIRFSAIFYYFFLQSWIPVIIFSFALHSPNNKIGKRIGILVIFSIFIVGSTILSSEFGLVLGELVPVLVLYGVIAFFLGFIARGIIYFTPLFRVFLIITALCIFPALTLYDVIIYSNPSNLTEARCNALGISGEIECFDKLARATNNPIACEGSFGDSATMNKCYNDIANKLLEENKLDLAICLKIPNHPGIVGEISGCVRQIAEKLNDVTKCEVLPDGGEVNIRKGCIGIIATKFKNFDYETRLKSCLVLGDKNDQVTCFSVVKDSFYDTEYYDSYTATFNQCKLLSGIDRDVCNFANMVKRIVSQRQCELISDSGIRKSCEAGSKKL